MINGHKYKGFSFKNYENNKSFILVDVDVVKDDLKNHIYTRFGERVKMASFGSRIPDMPFEPLDQTSLSIIYEDLSNVFKYDPRVEMLDLQIVPDFDNNIVLAYAKLQYIELNLIDTLDIHIEFDR